MVGTPALGGCATGSTGVVEGANGLLGLTVSGRNLAAATERGLQDATAHCADQGRQTRILGTQMGRDDYQLAFRCIGRTAVAQPAPAPVAAAPPMVLLQPEAAPLLTGAVAPRRPGAAPVAAQAIVASPVQALPPVAQAAPGLALLQAAAAPIPGDAGPSRRPEPAAPAARAPDAADLPPVASPLSVPPSRLLFLPPAPGLAPVSGLRRD